MRAFSSLLAATAVLAQPEQVHLSLTGSPTSMAVDFVAPAAAPSVTASFGTPAKTAPVNCVTETLNTYKAQFCTAVFDGLAPNTVYPYTLTAGGKAFTTNFTNQPSRDPVFAVSREGPHAPAHAPRRTHCVTRVSSLLPPDRFTPTLASWRTTR
jgi:hypothetical protein